MRKKTLSTRHVLAAAGVLLFTLAFLPSYSQLCFAPAVNYAAGPTTKAVCVGDFNKDGIQDLAVCIVGNHQVAIMLGTGTGTFGTAATYSCNTQPYSVCTADFNGDTNPDLAVANNGTFQGWSVLLGDGAGGFGSPTSYSAGTNPASICTGDFDNDGDYDIAVANRNSSPATVSIFGGNGNGTFTGNGTVNVGTGPNCVICAEVSGDARLDLVTANVSGNNVTVLLGQGGGNFASAGNFPVASTNPWSVCAADFNKDGKMDLATGNNNGSNVSVLLGTGSGQFAGANVFGAGTGPWSITAGDFDDDGNADVAVANSSSGYVSVLTGNGVGGLNTTVNFNTDLTPVSIANGDFNGDGKKDLVTANNNVNSNNASVLLNLRPGPVNISGTSSICAGTQNTLSASGAGNFSWSTGETTSSVIVSPTAATTYSATGTNTGCAATATGTFVVSTHALPNVGANATPTSVCAGNSTTLSGSGASSYAWSGGVSDGIGFIPTATASYTVTGTDGNNCSNTATVSVTVNQLPSVVANTAPNDTVCAGASVTLSGGGASSYAWSGGVSNGVGFVPSSTSGYTVTGTDGNGCSNTASTTVRVNLLPVVTATTTATTVCAGSNVTLSGGGANSYAWSGGISNGIGFTVTASSTYTVTGTDTNGCTNTAAISVQAATPPVLPICLVTVDSLSKYNLIAWDKTPFVNVVDSFIVYREISTNSYQPIGTVPYDSLSLFVDTVRTKYFPNTGDPNNGTYRYKIAAVDTCGNISAMSPYHNTIFITNNGGNFSWAQLYTIEGGSNPVANYVLMRDDLSTGNYQPVASVAGTQQNVSDPAYAAYQNTASWRIQTQWSISCAVTVAENPATEAINLNSSKSNVYRVSLVSANSIESGIRIIVSPNPNHGIFTVQSSESISEVRVTNLLGETVKEVPGEAPSSRLMVDLSSYENGVYFLRVKINGQEAVKKVVKD